MFINSLLNSIFTSIKSCLSDLNNSKKLLTGDASGFASASTNQIEAVFNEIQRSNMSKLGEDGKPIYREDGKVLKGPNYFKPNISEILEG